MQWGETAEDPTFLFHPAQGRVAVVAPPDTEGVRAIDLFSAQYDRFVTADIDNDGHEDLLLFGKQTTGIGIHLGGNRRISTPWKTIVPEMSVSDIVTTDLNGDGIIDLFVTDWVSNRIVLYIGIGRGVFSEQISEPLPGEPDRMAYAGDPTRKASQLAVTLPERKEIHLFSVNTLGEISPETQLSPVLKPLEIRFADVNSDGLQDIMTAGRKECVLFLAESSGTGFHRIPYGVEGELVDWELDDIDLNGTLDLLIATNNPSKLILIANRLAGRPAISWPDRYVTATSPRGIAIGDFNHDNRTDVAVVSPVSGTCSFFLNSGKGRFEGQLVVPIPNGPYSIRAVNRTIPGGPTFLISHNSSDEVTVLRPFSSAAARRQFTIPTDRLPYVISSEKIDASRSLSFLTRNGARNTGGLTVSLFEQISDEQFIETTVRPTIGQKISAISSADLTGDNIPDLLFTTPDLRTRTTGLFIARGIDRVTFRQAEQLFSFPDSQLVEIILQVGDIDHDRQADIVLALGPPYSSLVIVYPVAGGTAVDSVLWVWGIDVRDEEQLRMTDLDSDGDIDFCGVDRKTNTIVMIPGRGHRAFAPPRTIAPAVGVSSIGVGSFRSADSRDLVIVNGTTSTISFLFNPFKR